MKNKKIIIIAILLIIGVVLGLWISGIIPKQIARVYATNYLEKTFPKIELDYVDIGWNANLDGYLIRFKDKNEESYEFIISNRYLPIIISQGLFEFQEKYENISNNHEEAIVEFTRTYNIIADLNKKDLTGENNYYVISQYQEGEPTIIKINCNYNLQENANYEFSFKGKKINGKKYSIQEIFDTFEIVKIEKTDKIGMDQVQDDI